MIELPKDGIAHFASDLHLSENTPKTLEALENWLASVSNNANCIFLLGDVFEAWLGDDHLDSSAQRVQTALLSSAEAGAKLYFMPGNRDFLLGDAFCESSQMELLLDPDFIRVGEHVVLLSHGDQFCTDDKAYQKFRSLSRSESWQSDFLSKPLTERQEIASQALAQSAEHKKNSRLAIMDTNAQAVEDIFSGYWPNRTYIGRTDVVIHGHTHRCAIHGPKKRKNTTLLKETRAGSLQKGQRIVLPDWDFDHDNRKAPRGGALSIRGDGSFELRLMQ